MAVVRIQIEYTFMDETKKRTHHMTTGDDLWARIEKDVPEITITTSNQEKKSVRKAAALNKQPAKANPIAKTTAETPIFLTV